MPKRDPAPPRPEFEEESGETAQHDAAVLRVLDQVDLRDVPRPAVAPADSTNAPNEVRYGPRLRTSRVRQGPDGEFIAVFRGGVELHVTLDEYVDPRLIARAAASGDRVLIEEDETERPVVVGVVATRLAETERPDVLTLKARTIIIDAEDELLLRSGKAGMRLREDGDVELVGSRIVTMSRGLFRLVGKMLRLN